MKNQETRDENMDTQKNSLKIKLRRKNKNTKKPKENQENLRKPKKKSHIRETPTLSTVADSRTNTILERLRDFSLYIKTKQKKEKKLPPLPPPKGLLEGGAHPEHI